MVPGDNAILEGEMGVGTSAQSQYDNQADVGATKQNSSIFLCESFPCIPYIVCKNADISKNQIHSLFLAST
jgi:hypothetical protein